MTVLTFRRSCLLALFVDFLSNFYPEMGDKVKLSPFLRAIVSFTKSLRKDSFVQNQGNYIKDDLLGNKYFEIPAGNIVVSQYSV